MTDAQNENIKKSAPWVSFIFIILIFSGLLFLDQAEIFQPIKTALNNKPFVVDIGKQKISAYLVLNSILVGIFVFWLTKIIADFAESRIVKIKRISPSDQAIIIKLLRIAIFAIGFLMGVQILGINLTSFALFSGAIGIGLGFGLQKITSNFISGLILLFEKSIGSGDLVQLSDGTFGYVKKMSARFILIEALDGKEIMVPNETFITNQVTNWTLNSRKARIDIDIGIGYDDNVEKALEILVEAAYESPHCLKEPAASAFVKEFTDNSINLFLTFWVSDITAGRYRPKSDVMLIILKKFKEENISIPFPQRDVNIKNIDGIIAKSNKGQ